MRNKLNKYILFAILYFFSSENKNLFKNLKAYKWIVVLEV